jgi:hypothetical protein
LGLLVLGHHYHPIGQEIGIKPQVDEIRIVRSLTAIHPVLIFG